MNEETMCADCGHPAGAHRNGDKGWIGPCMAIEDDFGEDCVCEAFEPVNPF